MEEQGDGVDGRDHVKHPQWSTPPWAESKVGRGSQMPRSTPPHLGVMEEREEREEREEVVGEFDGES